jgi:hypothetical protein
LISIDRKKNKNNLVFGSLIIFALLMGTGVGLITGDISIQYQWGFIFLVISAIILWARELGRIPNLQTVGLMLVVLIVDILGVAWNNYYLKQFSIIEQEAEWMENLNKDDNTYYRIYSPSDSIPQFMTALKTMRFAHGVDPMQIRSYSNYMEDATGVPSQGYSVSIPPFRSGDPILDNAGYLPDPDLLGYLNVKYIVSEFELEHPALFLIKENGDSLIYRNEEFKPWAWIAPSSASLESGKMEQNEIPFLLEKKPNHISLQAEGPGILVLSEISYPGWIVTVDGKRSSISEFNHILRSVELEKGSHEVEFRYIPRMMYIGMLISTSSLIYIVWDIKRKKEF